jgi:deoxyribonuclease V
MIACVDVDYRDKPDQTGGAVAACILFKDWLNGSPDGSLVSKIAAVEPYVPGEFYKRELPCILQVLDKAAKMIHPTELDVVIVDSYVTLGKGHPGLGHHLWEALGRKVAVVGVAKTAFDGADAITVLRGDSKSPLYVTAAGIGVVKAADLVRKMHGEFRLPTLLKMVDRLCRDS